MDQEQEYAAMTDQQRMDEYIKMKAAKGEKAFSSSIQNVDTRGYKLTFDEHGRAVEGGIISGKPTQVIRPQNESSSINLEKLDTEIAALRRELEITKLKAEIKNMKLDNVGESHNTPMTDPNTPYAAVDAKAAGATDAGSSDQGATPTTVKDAASSVEDLLKGIADMHKRAMSAMDSYKAAVSGTENTTASSLKADLSKPEVKTEEPTTEGLLKKMEAMNPSELLSFYKTNRSLVGAAFSQELSKR